MAGNSALKNAATTAVGMNILASQMRAPILKNPFRAPKVVVLNGSIPQDSTKSYFFIDDACGLASQLKRVDAAADTGGIAFTTSRISIANIKEFLKTNAIVVTGYNLNISDTAQLNNNLAPIWTSLDATGSNDILFSSLDVSNMQFNENLLNVRTQPFVWTNQVALTLPVQANLLAGGAVTAAITCIIGGAVPYGKLDEYLAFAAIPAVNGGMC